METPEHSAQPAHPAYPAGTRFDKPVVTPQRFVELMNERLRRHPLYREGMQVYAVPQHTDCPRSLVCVGPRGTAGVCATIENIVRGECDVFPDIAQEWHRPAPDGARAR